MQVADPSKTGIRIEALEIRIGTLEIRTRTLIQASKARLVGEEGQIVVMRTATHLKDVRTRDWQPRAPTSSIFWLLFEPSSLLVANGSDKHNGRHPDKPCHALEQ